MVLKGLVGVLMCGLNLMEFFFVFSHLGCGVWNLKEMTDNGVARTSEEIKEVVDNAKKFNQGLYDRALILKESKTGGWVFETPLSLLHPLFALNCLYPQKRLVALELKLADPSKVLIKPANDNHKYRISLVECQLDLSYCTLESGIRTKYYELIEKEFLTRVFPLTKMTHFSLAKGQSLYQIPSVCAFGQSATHLTLIVTLESLHLGNYEPRFVYRPHDIKSLNVYKSGHPHFLNARMTNMDLGSVTRPDVFMFYNQFRALYPKKAASISLKKFFYDFFVFVIDLSAVPPKMRKDDEGDQNLSLITSAAVNLHIEFNKATTQNLVLYCMAHHQQVIQFTASGEIVGAEEGG